MERKALGDVIRALRQLEGLSREELGERAELGVDMIAKVEQGAKAPSASALKRLAAALGLDPIELSNRGLVWATMKDSPEASTALLRTVATAGMKAFPAMSRAKGGTPASVAAAAAAAALVGGAAGYKYMRDQNQKSKSEIEEALRKRLKRLEERLDQASPEDLENLENLAIAFEAAMPEKPAAE